ncbi:MAG TPA: rhodanese-like domain-containing protein [Acidimicrobiales bacterium]|nr:rhodanese-like domain-containing protein [Acidimicrobiales bacterium]
MTAPTAPEVGFDELAAGLEAGAPVIDVRNPDEYETVRVPGVRLIPLPELGERLGEVPKDQQVFVICAAGGRSLAAAAALNEAGYDAVSVAGGTNGWAAEGRPVESGA